MRGQQDIVQFPQAMRCHHRLFQECVDGRTGDPAIMQGVIQCVFIDNPAAGRID